MAETHILDSDGRFPCGRSVFRGLVISDAGSVSSASVGCIGRRSFHLVREILGFTFGTCESTPQSLTSRSGNPGLFSAGRHCAVSVERGVVYSGGRT